MFSSSKNSHRCFEKLGACDDNTVGDDFSDLSVGKSCRGILIGLLNAGLLELSISVSNSLKGFIDQEIAQLYYQRFLLKITDIMAKVE